MPADAAHPCCFCSPSTHLKLNPTLFSSSHRSEADQQYYDGTIHDYDLEVDCYNIAFEAHPDTTAALQFHQVGTKAEGRQAARTEALLAAGSLHGMTAQCTTC